MRRRDLFTGLLGVRLCDDNFRHRANSPPPAPGLPFWGKEGHELLYDRCFEGIAARPWLARKRDLRSRCTMGRRELFPLDELSTRTCSASS